MKIRKEELICDGIVSHVVLQSLINTLKEDKSFEKFFKDINYSNKEELEVYIMFEGKKFDIKEFCEHWQSQVHDMINKKAIKLVEDKFANIEELANQLSKKIRVSCKKTLGLEIDEYDY